VFDARETAPAAAKKNMFKGHPEQSLRGGKAIAVPLEVLGLHEAHRAYGVRPWKELFGEAIGLARDGFPAHPYLVSAIESNKDVLLHVPELRDVFFVDDGGWRPPRVNETCCRRPALAKVLRDISERGPDALYTGETAAGLAKDISDSGGLVTEADLAAAAVRSREPVRVSVFGSEILVPPPPSSGVSILLALRILEGFREPLAGLGPIGEHRALEAMKHAFAVRMHLGDDHGQQEALNRDVIADALDSGFAVRRWWFLVPPLVPSPADPHAHPHPHSLSHCLHRTSSGRWCATTACWTTSASTVASTPCGSRPRITARRTCRWSTHGPWPCR